MMQLLQASFRSDVHHNLAKCVSHAQAIETNRAVTA
jgi:hypothetical protein